MHSEVVGSLNIFVLKCLREGAFLTRDSGLGLRMGFECSEQ